MGPRTRVEKGKCTEMDKETPDTGARPVQGNGHREKGGDDSC